MRKLIFAILTTLFVSATPLHAAFASADGVDNLPSQACSTTFKDVFNDDFLAQIKEHHVPSVEVTGDDAKRLGDGIAAAFGPAPFAFDRAVVLRLNDVISIVFWFQGDCNVGTGKLPTDLIDKALNANPDLDKGKI